MVVATLMIDAVSEGSAGRWYTEQGSHALSDCSYACNRSQRQREVCRARTRAGARQCAFVTHPSPESCGFERYRHLRQQRKAESLAKIPDLEIPHHTTATTTSSLETPYDTTTQPLRPTTPAIPPECPSHTRISAPTSSGSAPVSFTATIWVFGKHIITVPYRQEQCLPLQAQDSRRRPVLPRPHEPRQQAQPEVRRFRQRQGHRYQR